MPATPSDMARAFAACVGRYAAAMEHSWTVGPPDLVAQQRREAFSQLLDAVSPEAIAQGASLSGLLSLRVNAKVAHARLLELAEFSEDDRMARVAATRARQKVRACDLLLAS